MLLNRYPYEKSIFSSYDKLSDYYNNYWIDREKSELVDNGLKITIEMPGFGREDVSIKAKENIMNIEIGEVKKYAYKISNKYDQKSIKASADKGILNVLIPYKEQAEEDNEIEITVD